MYIWASSRSLMKRDLMTKRDLTLVRFDIVGHLFFDWPIQTR